jgi:hypothetical protein
MQSSKHDAADGTFFLARKGRGLCVFETHKAMHCMPETEGEGGGGEARLYT